MYGEQKGEYTCSHSGPEGLMAPIYTAIHLGGRKENKLTDQIKQLK